MKKYLPGLTAIVCAFAFVAFTKPFTSYVFKLTLDPIFAGRVNNPGNWSTGGAYWGACALPVNEIACEIRLNTTRTSYFHLAGGSQVLNTSGYASGAVPKQDYLEILEGLGFGADRIIMTVIPKHWDSITGTYVTVSLGTDLAFKNGDD
jgi:hypothetical protein